MFQNLVFYSEWSNMLGEDGLEASLVTWQDPLLMGQFISSQLTLSKHHDAHIKYRLVSLDSPL